MELFFGIFRVAELEILFKTMKVFWWLLSQKIVSLGDPEVIEAKVDVVAISFAGEMGSWDAHFDGDMVQFIKKLQSQD